MNAYGDDGWSGTIEFVETEDETRSIPRGRVIGKNMKAEEYTGRVILPKGFCT